MTPWQLQQMIKASGWPLASEHLAPGADFNARLEGGLVPLTMAVKSGSFQVVMMVIDQLKALAAPPPDEALRQRLHDAFGQSHTDAKNRLQQTLKDWDRIARKAGGPASAP